MAEEQAQEGHGAEEQTTEEAWRQVGEQLEALGDSLSRAFRAAWESEETQQHVQSMQNGLEKMVEKVDRAVKEAGESAEARKLRAEAERTAESLQKAGDQTWQELRPRLISGLARVNAELEGFIERMEPTEPAGEAEEGAATENQES